MTREELVACEIEKKMNEFLEQLKHDVSVRIAAYIDGIDFTSKRFIAAKPIQMLKEIESILYDYYYNNDTSSFNSAAQIIALEKISDVFKNNTF